LADNTSGAGAPDFAERKRPFAPVHRRSLEIQQLDALLRIEELTQQLIDTLPAVLKSDELPPAPPKRSRK
jgi:hypothetical protein